MAVVSEIFRERAAGAGSGGADVRLLLPNGAGEIERRSEWK